MKCPECQRAINDANPLLRSFLDNRLKCHLCVIVDEVYLYPETGGDMSIYKCNECDSQKDSDYVGCSFDPRSEHELLCEDCSVSVNYELEAKQEGRANELSFVE